MSNVFLVVVFIYVLLLLNMPEMAHDWINKSILFYSIWRPDGSLLRVNSLILTGNQREGQ